MSRSWGRLSDVGQALCLRRTLRPPSCLLKAVDSTRKARLRAPRRPWARPTSLSGCPCFLLMLMSLPALHAQPYTLGVGVYPGDPRENFAPLSQADQTYRNLALHRPAYQSSSYDYNLTAQLITDGIKETRLPRWVSISTSQQGLLKKNEREWLLDRNWVTSVKMDGPHGWVQAELGGGETPLEIDRIDLQLISGPSSALTKWTAVASASDDGQTWREVGRAGGSDKWDREFTPSVAFTAPGRSHFYRVELDADLARGWQVSEIRFFNRGQRVEVGGPYDFTSAWKSAGAGEEWVYVDLGAACEFDRVALSWIRAPAAGALQISDDAANWKTLQPLAGDIKLAQPAHARYVRLLMSKPASPDGYILSEMEVYGRGGPVLQPKPAPAIRANGRLDLSGGQWRIQRDSLVTADGIVLSKPSFHETDWLTATVPGTVLTSYYNAGVLPDPNYGDNQLAISDSFFYADFWYRNEFAFPTPGRGKQVWLNFDGLNWKAEVFFNGETLGRIEGGFMRGRFDVTRLLTDKEANVLAVLVKKNATPGSVKEKTFDNPDKNGGALGADNPTFHASIGWDWIPTIRGRNTGIWNNVYLTTTGAVTVEDPFVSSKVTPGPGPTADVTIEVTLRNHDLLPVTGTLHGRFGDMAFDEPVSSGCFRHARP